MATRELLEKVRDNEQTIKVLLVMGLVAFAVASRLMPHPPNFSPVAAVALFAGTMLPRRWALVAPLGIMMISDFFIGLHPLIMYTWGSFVVIGVLSNLFMKKIGTAQVVGASVAASILFFLVTNFGVWAEGRLYPRTFEGLMNSYYNALPFFRNTLLGDLFYSGALFGAYAWISNRQASIKQLLATK